MQVTTSPQLTRKTLILPLHLRAEMLSGSNVGYVLCHNLLNSSIIGSKYIQ